MNASALGNPRFFWRTGLLVFLAVLLLSIPQAALLPLLDRDEPRFAEASREMLQSGNYVVPTFNHAPRYAKPPLIYWCQAISFRILGENAFAARLPSLLATAGTAWLLFAWGTQFGYKSIGLIAAFAYAFCLQTIQQGRVATADALLIFFMTLTVLAGWKLLELAKVGADAGQSWTFWGTILTLGFVGGFLAKGPEALLPFVPLMIMARHSGWRVLTSFAAILMLGLLIVALWAAPAYVMTKGDYWRVGMSEGVGQRMVTGMQGHGASSFEGYLLGVPFYLLLFWLSALPCAPLVITHGKSFFKGWSADFTDTYLFLNAGLIFLIFSLMVTKLPHYTLPAFPFLALFFARRWVMAGLNPGKTIRLALSFGVVLALIALLFAAKAVPSATGELVRMARIDGTLTPLTEFAVVDFQEPSVIWEMRRGTIAYGQAIPETEVLSFLGQPGPRAVVLSTALWQRIEPTLRRGDRSISWKTYETQGFNAAKGHTIDLTLVVKN